MKCKHFYSLTLFLLIQLYTASMVELQNTDLTVHHKKHKNTFEHVPTIEPLKATAKHPHQKLRHTTNLNKVDRKTEDYFKKTSKKNTSTAWKALSGFVLGIILFIVSIHVTCWNERRAVKETEFIDLISDEKRCKVVGPGVELEDKPSDNTIYIVNGPITVVTEAVVPDLNLELHTNKGKILMIKVKVDDFKIVTETKHEDMVDENGEEVECIQETEKKIWSEIETHENSKLLSKIHSGEALIDGRFGFSLTHLENNLSDFAVRAKISKNTEEYITKEEDIQTIKDYLGKEYESAQVFRDNNHFYVLSGTTEESDKFDPNLYSFGKSDRRITVLYVRSNK